MYRKYILKLTIIFEMTMKIIINSYYYGSCNYGRRSNEVDSIKSFLRY